MILRLLLAFGFMVLGATYPTQTLESARIIWIGVVYAYNGVYYTIYPPPTPKTVPTPQQPNQ